MKTFGIIKIKEKIIKPIKKIIIINRIMETITMMIEPNLNTKTNEKREIIMIINTTKHNINRKTEISIIMIKDIIIKNMKIETHINKKKNQNFTNTVIKINNKAITLKGLKMK